jgi:hypothetical protein
MGKKQEGGSVSYVSQRLAEIVPKARPLCYRCGGDESVEHRRITFPAAKKKYPSKEGKLRSHYYENLESTSTVHVCSCFKCFMKIKTHADNALRAVETMGLLNDLWKEIREQIRDSNNGAASGVFGNGHYGREERRPFR